ncbi:MAG: glycosyltransferase [Candidatus Omnitrophica bacterium]|nr:glycosyltransferase [Candidatus Omnitrophota bacterium]MDD5237470.1 glycosyltransferase [Candidatus Omnitrophota bacterium]
MKILHLIESLDIGGAQLRLWNDLRFMDKNRFKNIVCSLNGSGRLSAQIKALGIPVYCLNGTYNLGSALKLASIIRKNHVDIIHTQLFFSDLYGRLMGKMLGVPAIVSTVQSSVYEPDNEYLYSLKRKLLDSYSGRLCNKKFIAVSEFVKSSLSRRLKISMRKIEVIPNYVDFEELNSVQEGDLGSLREEFSISPQDLILITVCRLNPAKGVQYLLKAMQQIVAQYKFVRLLIVGDGFYRSCLEQLVKAYNLKSNVMFLGERNDVKELLHISNIFVFPSLSEGLPLSLLEAMACGLPSVASDIGPVREIISDGRTGLLARSKDSAGIARAVSSLIADSKKAKVIGECGKDLVRDKFSPCKNIKFLEDFYLSLS